MSYEFVEANKIINDPIKSMEIMSEVIEYLLNLDPSPIDGKQAAKLRALPHVKRVQFIQTLRNIIYDKPQDSKVL